MYVRLSQNREHDEDKPQRQIDACSGWLTARSITDVATYQDDDRSAYRGKPRPAYRRLLADIGAGRVTQVVALHVDRLLRNMTEMESLIALAESTGCQVHTVESGALDLTTSAGRGMARMMANFATIEVERKSERHLSKAQQMRAQGRGMGRRPFGWTSVNGTLDTTEAKLLRQGIEDVLEGKSLNHVARTWNAAGSTTTANRAWTTRAVREVLCRWRNAGVVTHQDQPVEGVTAVWPAVATREEVLAVIGTLTNPERRTSPGPTPRWLLSNIATCGTCGVGMVVGTQYSKSWGGTTAFPVYRCSNSKSTTRPRCFLTIKAATLEEAVHHAVRERLTFAPPADLTPTQDERAAMTKLRAERAELVESEQGIAARVGSGEWPLSVADAALSGIRARRQTIDAEVASIVRRYALASLLGDGPATDGRVSMTRAAEIGSNFRDLDLGQRRAIIRAMMTVTVQPGRDPAERIEIRPVSP